MTKEKFTIKTIKQITRDELMKYTIRESKYGLFISSTTCGVDMVTAPTEESCRRVTEGIHIPSLLGEFDGDKTTSGSAVVGGKL